MNRSIRDLDIPKQKPSLAEIAAMPYPASELTMRRFYDPLWGKGKGAGGDTVMWEAEISYSYAIRESAIVRYQIEAGSAEDAKRVAEDLWQKDEKLEGGIDADDYEIDDIDIQELSQ